MRSLVALATFTFLATIIPFGSSQSIQDLPPCSFECILDAVALTVCSSTDYPCICRTSSTYITGMIKCLAGACSTSDAQSAATVVGGICNNLQIPLASPSSASNSASSTITSSLINTRTTTGAAASMTTSTSTTTAIITTPHSTLSTATSTLATPSFIYAQPTTTTPFQSSTPNTSSATNGSLSEAAKVGLGLSIPVASGLIGVLFWLLNRNRRRKRMEEETFSRAIGVNGPSTRSKMGNARDMLGWKLWGDDKSPVAGRNARSGGVEMSRVNGNGAGRIGLQAWKRQSNQRAVELAG